MENSPIDIPIDPTNRPANRPTDSNNTNHNKLFSRSLILCINELRILLELVCCFFSRLGRHRSASLVQFGRLVSVDCSDSFRFSCESEINAHTSFLFWSSSFHPSSHWPLWFRSLFHSLVEWLGHLQEHFFFAVFQLATFCSGRIFPIKIFTFSLARNPIHLTDHSHISSYLRYIIVSKLPNDSVRHWAKVEMIFSEHFDERFFVIILIAFSPLIGFCAPQTAAPVLNVGRPLDNDD